MARNDIVRACEIGSYVFCARAWWLHRVKGYQTASLKAMERGNSVHSAHGRSVASSVQWKRLACFFLILALASGLISVWQLFAM